MQVVALSMGPRYFSSEKSHCFFHHHITGYKTRNNDKNSRISANNRIDHNVNDS